MYLIMIATETEPSRFDVTSKDGAEIPITQCAARIDAKEFCRISPQMLCGRYAEPMIHAIQNRLRGFPNDLTAGEIRPRPEPAQGATAPPSPTDAPG
jgi:hypothetical protein